MTTVSTVRLIPALLLLALFAGCASGGTAGSTRQAPTGIRTGERVVVMLDDYREEGNVSAATPEAESSVEHCVKMGMLRKDIQLQVFSAQECRKAVYPACSFETAPRNAEKLLESLQDPGTVQRYAELGVRYVVSVSVNSSKGARRTTGDFGGGSGGWAGYVNSYTPTYTAYGATVIDIPAARIAGRAWASDEARAGGGVAVIMILPIPYAYVGAPGSIACRELGSTLADLLLH